MLPHLLLQAGEPRVERRWAPAEGLEAHGRRDLRVLQELEGVRDEEAPEPRHHGGSVQDREPFLRLQAEGPEAGGPQGGPARDPLLALADLSFADHHEGDVGEWREISARPQGSPRGHDGVHPPVQHPEEQLHDRGPDPRVALREGVRTDQNRGPDVILPERGARPRRVTPDEVLLEPEEVRLRDRGVLELAESRVHAVHGTPALHDPQEGRAGRLDATERDPAQRHRFSGAGDPDDLLDGEGFPINREQEIAPGRRWGARH